MSVTSKVADGLLDEAVRWGLALTRPTAEAIAEEVGLTQALKLRMDAPSDKAAADTLFAEKREILREATGAAIAKATDAQLKADLQRVMTSAEEMTAPA